MRIAEILYFSDPHAARFRTQKSPKIRHLRTIVQLCWTISPQLRHVLTIRKNL